MNRLNLKITISAIALILLPGLALAEGKISLKLQGGWAYISGGDVNHGTQAYFDLREAQWGASEGGYRAVHNSYEIGGDIIYELTPRLGLSFGAGYLRISRTSRAALSIPEVIGPYAGLIAEPTLDAVPIRLGLDFVIPLNKRLNLHTEIGASYFFRARYSDEWRMLISSMDTVVGYVDIVTRAERKRAPIGFQGGIGLEYMLSQKLSLVFDAKGRYARFTGWHGSSVLESDTETPFSEEGSLYYENVPMLAGSPRLIMVQSDPPNGPGGEPRQAAIDFSGVNLQFGIQIRL
jgi:hypothetical protein